MLPLPLPLRNATAQAQLETKSEDADTENKSNDACADFCVATDKCLAYVHFATVWRTVAIVAACNSTHAATSLATTPRV